MNIRQWFKLSAGAGLVTMLLGVLMVVAPGAGAHEPDLHENDPSLWTVTFNGASLVAGDTQFSYTIVRTPGTAEDRLSHVEVADFCLNPIGVSPSFTEDGKWENGNDLESGQTYVITFDGDQTGSIDPEGSTWILKKNQEDIPEHDVVNGEKTVTSSGPSCQTPPPYECPTGTTWTDLNSDGLKTANECNPVIIVVPDPGPQPEPTPEPEQSLQVAKVVTGDAPAEWTVGFDVIGGSLDESTTVNNVGPSDVFSDIDADTYTITETDVTDGARAILTDVTCEDDGEDVDVTVDEDTSTATVEVPEGASVVCTFTNEYSQVLPNEETPTEEPTPAATPDVEVKGVQTVRALPRTGDESRGLAGMGALMLAVGAAMVLGSKRQLARR